MPRVLVDGSSFNRRKPVPRVDVAKGKKQFTDVAIRELTDEVAKSAKSVAAITGEDPSEVITNIAKGLIDNLKHFKFK